MRAHGAHTALVSGGFTQFTEPVAERIGFHETRANRLEIADGALTGRGRRADPGKRSQARDALSNCATREGCRGEATLAIGDGANDLDMLREAGLGVAFHAKPKVAQRGGCAHRSCRSDRAALCAGV